MSKLPARTGWTWLKQGIGLFRKQPAALTTLLFANILISIGISALPLVGPLLAVVLIPSFSMAFMQACLMIEHGQRISPGVLLTGFRRPTVFALCKVGLLYLAVTLLLALLTHFIVGEGFWRQVAGPIDPKTGPAVALSDLLGVLLIVVLDIAALMALCFAAPLTTWQKMGPGKAIFYSFFAVLRSARVFVVLLLSWFGIFFAVCMVITLIFGSADLGRVLIMWVIFLFILLLQCAMYAGYRQIFGVPELAAKPLAEHDKK
jgi:hypothetical protein